MRGLCLATYSAVTRSSENRELNEIGGRTELESKERLCSAN
jgi:hypothetical protein